jgi:hypothetical protein
LRSRRAPPYRRPERGGFCAFKRIAEEVAKVPKACGPGRGKTFPHDGKSLSGKAATGIDRSRLGSLDRSQCQATGAADIVIAVLAELTEAIGDPGDEIATLLRRQTVAGLCNPALGSFPLKHYILKITVSLVI